MLKNIIRQKSSAKSFVRTHFVSIKDLDKPKIEKLLNDAAQLKKQVQKEGKLDICRGKVVGLLFCEQSTRTTSSFNVAALKLGADVLPLDYNNSSSKKGETLEDTLRVFENYCDTIVMRHPQAGIFQKMIPFVKKPLVNAGDGVGEHPTQAMLDLFTIQEELGSVDGKTVTLMGDLKHGRTVHSLMYLLKNFNNVTVNLVAPSHLAFPEEILNEMKSASLKINHSADLTQQIVSSSDILYVTRLQRERFLDEKDFFKVASGYTVNEKMIAGMKPSARILHPLPRVDELSPAIDNDQRAVYLTKQVANGVFMRMSILASVLGKI